MDGSKKKTGKKVPPQKSKILDNALLHETSRPEAGKLFSPAAEIKKKISVVPNKIHEVRHEIKREALVSVKKEVEEDRKPLEHRSPDNGKKIYARPDNGKKVRKTFGHAESDVIEKVDVFKIISDLEKQLDAAFSLKDIQEKEIQDLKEDIEKAEERTKILEAELEETKGKLVAQRKLELELESFENEQFEMLSEKRLLKGEIEAGSTVIKDLENKIAALAKEDEGWNARIGQMEQEILSGNAGVQNLRHQIFALEDEKGVLSSKIEALEAELSSVTTERERYKKELGQAKESLDEIRLTLVDTRTRARGRYYKNKSK